MVSKAIRVASKDMQWPLNTIEAVNKFYQADSWTLMKPNRAKVKKVEKGYIYIRGRMTRFVDSGC